MLKITQGDISISLDIISISLDINNFPEYPLDVLEIKEINIEVTKNITITEKVLDVFKLIIKYSKNIGKTKKELSKWFEDIIYNIPRQFIFYGPAGVGKSYSINSRVNWINECYYCLNLLKDDNKDISILRFNTIFHTNYTFFDFMGKELPVKKIKHNYETGKKDIEVSYDFLPGIFLIALNKVFQNIIQNNNQPVFLVIEEINRGNASAIFGNIFNLLDRNNNIDSEYTVDIFGMIMEWLLKQIIGQQETAINEISKFYPEIKKNIDILENYRKESLLTITENNNKSININTMKIFLPANLYIYSTMNTSDDGVIKLDKAFERRWQKTFLSNSDNGINHVYFENKLWIDIVDSINKFIIENEPNNDLDNAVIGYWFIKPNKNNKISINDFKYSLMYHLWYSLFNNDRKILGKYLTFKDFSEDYKVFLERIMKD